MKQISPLGKRVLIQPIAAEKKTEGGIIIPDTSGEKPMHGNVIAVGDEVKCVNVGDVAMYDRYRVFEFELNGEKQLIVQEEDLIGIIK